MAIIPKQVLLGWESTFGESPVSPTPYQLCAKENGIVFTRETETTDCMGGAIDSGGDLIETGTTIEGNMVTNGYWEQVGVYFKAVLGEPVTVDNTDGTYTHTFDTTKDTQPSMYIETISGDDALVECVNGGLGNTLDFTISGKGLFELTMGVIANSHVDNLKDTYSKMDDSGKIPMDTTKIRLSTSFAKIDNGDFCKFSEFAFKVDRGIETTDLLCDEKDIGLTMSDISGSIKAVWDSSFYQRVASNTTSKIEVGFIEGDNQLIISVPEMQFDFTTAPKVVKEKVLVDTNYVGSRSASGTAKAEIILTNTVASYA